MVRPSAVKAQLGFGLIKLDSVTQRAKPSLAGLGLGSARVYLITHRLSCPIPLSFQLQTVMSHKLHIEIYALIAEITIAFFFTILGSYMG